MAQTTKPSTVWLKNPTFAVTNLTGVFQTTTKNPQDLRILIPLILCCTVVFLIGVPGNSMVIYVLGICRRQHRGSNGNVFIVNLAVADVLASATVPLVIIHDLLSAGKWNLGSFLCYLLPALNPVTLVASSWALVAISIDRYRIISRPFSTVLPTKTKSLLIGAVWMIGVATTFPFAVRIVYIDNDVSMCTAKPYMPAHQISYASCYTAVGWTVPGIILATLYYKTANQLKMSEMYHSNVRVMQQQIRKENREVVRMFVVVIALFFACTMPNAVYQIVYHYIYLFGTERPRNYLIQMYTILPCLSAINSCINPLVYAKMHKEINRYVRRLLTRLRGIVCFQGIQNLDLESRSQREDADTNRSGSGLLPKPLKENASNCSIVK